MRLDIHDILNLFYRFDLLSLPSRLDTDLYRAVNSSETDKRIVVFFYFHFYHLSPLYYVKNIAHECFSKIEIDWRRQSVSIILWIYR